jgi:Flp pilus assembly protein TadD
LCLDYGWPAARTVSEVLFPAILLVGLLILTAWALVRRPAWGFLGVWFFAILAPTSSFLPLRQAAFEHRMYLALAAVVTSLVASGWLAGQWLVRRRRVSLPTAQLLGGSLSLLAGAALGVLTFQRNLDYRSVLAIWEDTVATVPDNACSHHNLGVALAQNGQLDEAMAEYRKAMKIKPDYADPHNNLGNALAHRGRLDEAIAQYRKALEINPEYAAAYYNFGAVLYKQGHVDEAILHLQKAVEIEPDNANFHGNFGLVLGSLGQFDEAIVHYQKALETSPGDVRARENLGIARSQRDHILKALAERRESLRAHPNDVALLNETAWLLATNPNASIRNGAEATELAQRAVRLSDGREPAILDTLAAAYAEAGRFAEAVQTARKALELAAQQNQRSLAESMKAKILRYEAGRPFREIRQLPAARSIQP